MPASPVRTASASRRRHARRTCRALALAGALVVLSAGNGAAQPQPTAGPPPGPPITIVRVNTPSRFDWADAGLGAAAGVAVSLAALGGALAVTRRRDRDVHASARAG
jgi:hypothetical protein